MNLYDSLAGDMVMTHSVDAADESFAAELPTSEEPSGDGIIKLTTREGSMTPPSVKLIIVGTGADNAVLTGMRVIGWEYTVGVQGAGSALKKGLWMPTTLFECAAVLGALTGVDGTKLPATYFFADTITPIAAYNGNANISHEVVSPVNDGIAHVIVLPKGCRLLKVKFDIGLNMTGANCLWRPV